MNKKKSDKKVNNLGPKTKAVILVGIIILALVGLYLYNEYKLSKNNLPEITYFFPGQATYISDSHITPLVYDKLIAGVVDKDGDSLVVSFWVKEHSSSQWRSLVMFQGFNGTYVYNLPVPYSQMPPRTTTMDWRIDVFDGHNVTSKVVTF